MFVVWFCCTHNGKIKNGHSPIITHDLVTRWENRIYFWKYAIIHIRRTRRIASRTGIIAYGFRLTDSAVLSDFLDIQQSAPFGEGEMLMPVCVLFNGQDESVVRRSCHFVPTNG